MGLNLKAVSRLNDGDVQRAFDDACKDLMADCKERPLLVKDRSVVLALLVRPVTGSNDEYEDISVQAIVKHRIPPEPRRRDS